MHWFLAFPIICVAVTATFSARENGLAGAEGFRPRHCELASDALACPRRAAKSLFVEIRGLFETLKFREPYRSRGVQSFGDKCAFRRTMRHALPRRSPEFE
jgi:hypothetical protein